MSNDGLTPLEAAIKAGHLNVLRVLLDKNNKDGAIHLAIKNNQLDIVNFFVKEQGTSTQEVIDYATTANSTEIVQHYDRIRGEK